LIDYLSQEFEDDGEIRIYINGRHPEIADFLGWLKVHPQSRGRYGISLRKIYSEYVVGNGIPESLVHLLPIEMVDELIRKEADPDYQMDLASIQNRYIAEGKAVVSEDGKEIEFIVPDSK
jgi:acylphosphatase